MSKLNPQYLEDLRKQINRVQHMATSYDTYTTNRELLDIVDNMSRVAGFLASEMRQHISRDPNEAADPEEYLNEKIKLATSHMTRYYDKTKSTSR